MNNTFGDLMAEYVAKREAARCFSSWDSMNQFVEGLIRQLVAGQPEKYKVSDFAKPIITPESKPVEKYSFDANGSEIHGQKD